jgi:hypothetical protein
MFEIPFTPNSRSLWGVWGAAIVLVSAAVVIPQYTRNESRLHTLEAMSSASDIKQAITGKAIDQNSLIAVGRNIKLPSMESEVKSNTVKGYIEVTDNGVILLQDGFDRQLVVMIPRLDAGKVHWRCLGGSAAGVPANCKFRSR